MMMPPGMPPAGMAPGRFLGRIKSFNPRHGFGFIDCPDAHARFGRDVFVHKAQIGGLEVGDDITFRVEPNKDGMPQARDILRIDGQPPGPPPPNRDQPRRGRSNGRDRSRSRDSGYGAGGGRGRARRRGGKGKKKDGGKGGGDDSDRAPSAKAKSAAPPPNPNLPPGLPPGIANLPVIPTGPGPMGGMPPLAPPRPIQPPAPLVGA